MEIEELLQVMNTHPNLNITFQIKGAEDSPIFKEWAWRWATSYKMGVVKDNTYFDSFERQLRLHLIPYFGELCLRDIKPIDIQEYFSRLHDTYSVESQHKLKVCLHELFEAAKENGYCDANPVTKSIRLQSTVTLHDTITWSRAEYETAWCFAAKHPLGVSIMMLMETGMNRGEMLGIRRREFDPVQKVLCLNDALVPVKCVKSGKVESIHRGLKNKYRKRKLPISDELTKHLLNMPDKVVVNDKPVPIEYLICSPTGQAYHPNNWYHRCYLPFMRDLREAHPEIPYITPREMRHTRASLLHSDGVDLYDIQKLMGHKDLTMLSRRYLHTNVELLRDHLGL